MSLPHVMEEDETGAQLGISLATAGCVRGLDAEEESEVYMQLPMCRTQSVESLDSVVSTHSVLSAYVLSIRRCNATATASLTISGHVAPVLEPRLGEAFTSILPSSAGRGRRRSWTEKAANMVKFMCSAVKLGSDK